MDPWQWWSARTIAEASGCPEGGIREHWPGIAAALDARGIWERDVARGVIATVAIETASTFAPVREAFWASEEWRRANLSYYPHYGRGHGQLTHVGNYERAGTAIGVDLVADPDVALRPDVSYRVLAWMFATWGVPSKDGARWYSLVELCRERDWEWVRRVIQGGTAGLERLVATVTALGEAQASGQVQGSGIATTNEDGKEAMLRVTEDGVRLRAEPSTDAAILTELRSGATVVPLNEHAWRQVRAGGQTGWIAAELLESAPSTSNSAPNSAQLVSNYVQFDPNTPTELQVQSWTCSIRSVMWMLKSLGISVTAAEAQDSMVPKYVEYGPDGVGLRDGSGAGIVEYLRERWGLTASNFSPVSFDAVASWAGRMPVAMGGHNWAGPNLGHWTAVRGVDDSGRLVLANPAGTGPLYGQQTLTREQFGARAPWSAVVIPLG